VAASTSGFAVIGGCTKELAPGVSNNCPQQAQIPENAKLTAAHFKSDPNFVPGAAKYVARYLFDADVPFGLPFRPTPFTAKFDVTINSTPISVTLPIKARSEDIFAGEKREEIHVVPAFALTTTPEILVVSTTAASAAKDVRVTVTNHAKGTAKADVALH